MISQIARQAVTQLSGGTRAKRGEQDASRATPENVQPDTDRASARDVAGWTGLEPAASGVTGRRSNQLNYHPESKFKLQSAKQVLTTCHLLCSLHFALSTC
jgi:hypothetical protein